MVKRVGTRPSVWPLVSSRERGDYRVFKVRQDVTRSARSGRPHDFFVLECTDWANVVALTDSREVVLVRQFRAGTRSVRRIGVVHPNPAIQGNRCFTYLATGCRSVGDLMPDEGEDLAVELVP